MPGAITGGVGGGGFDARAYLPGGLCNVLYPGADDPRAVAAATAAIIHDGASVEAALAAMDAERDKEPRLA